MPVLSRAAFAGLLATGLALAALPSTARAQRDRCRYWSNGRWYECRVEDRRRDDYHYRFGVPHRQVSLLVGALRYDLDGRETIPMAAIRGDWRLSRALRSELGLAYGMGDVPSLRTTPTTTPGTVNAHVLESTLGLLAELPTPYLRPYIGAAAGLFARFDDASGPRAPRGERFVRPALAFPVGFRAYLSPRLAIRAETRFRFDQQPSGASATNTEFTGGLSVGY